MQWPDGGRLKKKKKKKKKKTRRFSVLTKAEIEKKKEDAVPKNTKRAIEKAGRIFRAYLLEADGGEGRFDFEQFDIEILDQALYIVQLSNDREDQPLRRFMFAVFIHSQKSSSAYFHCFSDKYYDIHTFF